MKTFFAHSKKTLTIFLVSLVFFFPFLELKGFNLADANSYLLAHADNPWSTMALTALGKATVPIEHLKAVSSNNAIDYATPILAITALNQDPRNFANEDLVAKLKSFHSNEQLGDEAALNDDIFGALALIASGETMNDTVIIDSKNFILSHQNQDGGWSFTTSGASDTNMAAAAVVALIASGVADTDPKIQTAIAYLRQAQNSDGGFPYDPQSPYGKESDSSSTAWVIWALNSLKINPGTWDKGGSNPISYLESNQTPEGYFKYQSNSTEDAFSAVTTAYAIIALSGKTLPLNIFSTNQSTQNFPFRIEGSNETICEGQTAGPTALDIVKNAASQCGFSYNITQTAYGPYLDKINNDQASGLTGWLYLVSNVSPSVGAADYILKTGENVLWYFGNFDWKPSRLSLSSDKIATSQNAQALVEFYENGNWQTLEGALVYFGVKNTITDAAGYANLSAPDGYYKVFAQKDGYIRSNSVLLEIGEPNKASVSLEVDISGEVQGTTTPDVIAFIVGPDNLDFGQMIRGSSKTKTLSIKNTGSKNLQIESIVEGDSVFKDNLLLDNLAWGKFKNFISASQNQDVNVSLNIPASYNATSGKKAASLTFWAAAE